jgi:probable F420-dependent oxidoreductase
VKVGFHVPQWGPMATRRGTLEVARCVEAAGLDSLWVSDHVVCPVETATPYPFAARTPFTPEDGYLEGLTLLAAIAAATERVELGTSVLVASQREPLLLAKAAATIDVLSGGRLVLAVGSGWWREEFEALGAPFESRGRRTDETIQVLRLLWREGVGSFEGETIRFPEVVCLPRPVREGGPPILVGGLTQAALRRAARLGDGWHGVGSRVERLADARGRLDELAAAEGRDPRTFRFSTSAGLPRDPAVAVERLGPLAGIGLDHLVLGAAAESAADLCRRIESFAVNVLPALRAGTGAAPS